MQVEPRALASLSVVTRANRRKVGGRAPHHVHVWSALRVNLPAVQQLYDALDYAEGPGPKPHMRGVTAYNPTQHSCGPQGWHQSFRRVFSRMGPLNRPDFDELTSSACAMRETGRLTAL